MKNKIYSCNPKFLIAALAWFFSAPLVLAVSPGDSSPQQIWISPNHDDQFDLLSESPEDWSFVQTHIHVFKMHVNTIQKMPIESLRELAKIFHVNHIAIGVEVGGVRDWQCSGAKMAGIEGASLDRLIEAGGVIEYIAMDSPIGYTVREAHSPCGYTMEQAAQETLAYMKLIRQKIPKVRFGLIEPVPWYHVDEYRPHEGNDYGDLHQLIEILSSVLEKGGERIDFFEADSPYDFTEGTPQGWQKLKALQKIVQSHGIRFGLIFNSDRGGSLSDDAFHRETIDSYEKFKSVGGNPDDLIIQSWYPYPQRLLPEDQPYSFMYLVKRFISKIGN